jgi:hypothetical protein
MKSQKQTEKDAKATPSRPEDAAPNVDEPSEIGQELTDIELAAVAGGAFNAFSKPENS